MRTLLIDCLTSIGIKNILIKDDLIEYIGAEKPEHDDLIDCSGLVILPGMIDAHVHVRDMEMSYKETWETASKAAIAGGITMIMDMPNTKPATIDHNGLVEKREAAKRSLIKYKFHLGATTENLNELKTILSGNPQDVAGIKIFLAGSSSNEVVEYYIQLKEIFQIAKEYDKVILVHTEMQSILEKWQNQINEKNIFNHNQLRNREAAIEGTKLVLKIAEEVGSKIYICHVSTREEIELIRVAKQTKNNIFCEVTPHHLVLNEAVLKYAGNFGKVNPPLRTNDDNRALLKAVIDGTVDCLGTDHAPHSLDEKIQEYLKAPSGFPGLETAIPMTYFLVKEGHISLQKYSELISGNTADIFGLDNAGTLNTGSVADLLVLDPNINKKINTDSFKTKAKYSPFEGMIGKANVKYAFVNGKIYEN